MPLPNEITEEQVNAVRAALESPEWDWRTIGGVASETKLPVSSVQSVLRHLIHQGDVIRSEFESAEGEKLYTARSRYEKNATLWDRFKAAILNRAG